MYLFCNFFQENYTSVIQVNKKVSSPTVSEELFMQISNLNFFLLVLTTVMIAAGGYIINDYFDLKIDPINKPDKMILGAKINATKAETAYYMINALAVAIGVYLGYRFGSISIVLLIMVCATVLYFYSLN